jgi:hypothetical protein
MPWEKRGTHTVRQVGEGVDELGQVARDDIVLLAEAGTRRSATVLLIWCLVFGTGLPCLLQLAGRRPPDARVAEGIAVEEVFGHGCEWVVLSSPVSINPGFYPILLLLLLLLLLL